MDAHTVLQRAAAAHLRLIRFLYCDNGGIIRGKATHVNSLVRRMGEGIGQTLAMQAFASVDALAAVDGMAQSCGLRRSDLPCKVSYAQPARPHHMERS